MRSALLLSLALGAIAEETPAPVVPPPAEAAPAPAPVAAPAATPEAARGAAAPAVDPNEEEIVLAPVRRLAAGPTREKLVTGFASLGVGYDSNVLQVSTNEGESRNVSVTANDLTATDARGIATTVDASVGVRVLTTALGRLTASGSAGCDWYPGQHAADLVRYGGNLAASFTSIGVADPGAVVSFTRFLLDGHPVANATSFNPYVAIVGDRQVGIVGVSSQYLDFLQDHYQSGKVYDASYRHWLLWQEGNIARRVELSLRAAAFRSLDQRNDYGSWTPGVALLWRFGDQPAPGTVDAALRTTWERRQYREIDTEPEDQHLFSARASADAWLSEAATVGPYLAFTRRVSNNTYSEFDRIQVGIRTTVTW